MSQVSYYNHADSFILENGIIENLRLAYCTYGERNSNDDNIIWVFHALTASADVLSWWPGLFGKDCLYDPDKYFIICVNIIGSPYGSTRPNDLSFPDYTTRDVIKANLLLADHLKINRIHTAIGGSFGGNQALEFAFSFKGVIDHLILIVSCAKESAWSIASHEAQRLALQADNSFGKPNEAKSGLKAARAMAMLNYRTAESFIERQTDSDGRVANFNASSYIRYQGEKFVNRFDSLCYYYLTKLLDTHDIGRDRGGQELALQQIQTNSLVIGIDTDLLIPTDLQKFMVQHLPNATYQEINSKFGHDGFLIEVEKLSEKIQEFYNKNL